MGIDVGHLNSGKRILLLGLLQYCFKLFLVPYCMSIGTSRLFIIKQYCHTVYNIKNCSEC